MPASLGNRLLFLLLQRMHEITTFSQEVLPRGHGESHDPCSILWKEVLSAILAPEFVTLQKILAIELHFLHEHPVIGTQNQNTGTMTL